jgi:hypothetical protein
MPALMPRLVNDLLLVNIRQVERQRSKQGLLYYNNNNNNKCSTPNKTIFILIHIYIYIYIYIYTYILETSILRRFVNTYKNIYTTNSMNEHHAEEISKYLRMH